MYLVFDLALAEVCGEVHSEVLKGNHSSRNTITNLTGIVDVYETIIVKNEV